MATGRDTSVDVIQASNERSSSAGTNEVETTDPPRIDRSTAENIQSERRDRYAKAVKLDETLDAFLVRLRLTSGIDVEDQILKIFCTEDKKHGVEQALQVELRDVDKILHPFVQVEEVDTEFSVVRHKGDVAADWSDTDILKDDGRVVIEPVRLFKEDKDLDSINPHETEVESLDNDAGHKDCPDAEDVLQRMWEASIIHLYEAIAKPLFYLQKQEHESPMKDFLRIRRSAYKEDEDTFIQTQEWLSHSVPDSTNVQALPQKDKKYFIVGIGGVGKSSLGNVLAGKSVFKSSSRMESETSRVTPKTNCMPTHFAPMQVKITDTPGYSYCRVSDTKAKADAIHQLADGINVLVFITSPGRFTPERNGCLEWAMSVAGPGILHRTILTIANAPDGLPDISSWGTVIHQLADGINDFVFITSPGWFTPERNGWLEWAMSVAGPGILHHTILTIANAPDGLPDISSWGTAPLSTPNEDWHDLFPEQKYELERILAHVEWVVMQLVAWILTSIKIEAKINAKLFESQMQAGVAALKLHNNMDPTWVSQYIYCWRNVYNNIKDME